MVKEKISQLHQALRGHTSVWWLKRALVMLVLVLLGGLLGWAFSETVPAYGELRVVEGSFWMVEERDSGERSLVVQEDSGLIQPFSIADFVELENTEALPHLAPGDRVELRCQKDEYHSVMELTVGEIPLLRYAQVRAAYERENRWSYVLGISVSLLCGLVGAVILRSERGERRRRAESARAIEAALLERARHRDATPACYDSRERKSLEDYVKDAFGPIAQVFHEPEGEGGLVDIAVVEPTERENFYRLLTIGMGARAMAVPAELAERNCAFGELCLYLPPDWKLLSSDPQDTWPFHWLKTVARLPLTDCDWLGVGHSVHTGPLGGEDGPTELLLTWAAVREGSSPRLLLPGGRLVNFYQLMPLYPSEMLYYRERGFARLWQRLLSRGVTPVVDLGRESCYDPETDLEAELAPFSWSGDAEEQCLSLQAGWFLQEHFERAGLSGSGYDWETLAQALLSRELPRLRAEIRFASDEDLFCAYSAREEALRAFAFALRDLCDQEEKFDWLLDRMPEE